MRWALVAGVVVAVLLLGRRVAFAAKPGAVLSDKPEIVRARRIVAQVWQSRGATVTVTSGLDGTHQAKSLHYEGLAEDYRTSDAPKGQLLGMVSEIRALLGGSYDVVLESTHLHVEFDPK